MIHPINKRFYSWNKMPKHIRDKLNVLPKSRTIPIASNKLTNITENNITTSLVIYGDILGSIIGFKLNLFNLNKIYLNPIISLRRKFSRYFIR